MTGQIARKGMGEAVSVRRQSRPGLDAYVDTGRPPVLLGGEACRL
ncbi:MAG: hypothetical protein ACR2G7_08520 [Acidimicrobiales bacterium]